MRRAACTPSNLNGIEERPGYLTVTQTGTSFHISTSSTDLACTFDGLYSQYGKLGDVEGTYSCSDGTVGSFSMYEMTPSIYGFTGYVSGQNQYCQFSAQFGGITRAQ